MSENATSPRPTTNPERFYWRVNNTITDLFAVIEKVSENVKNNKETLTEASIEELRPVFNQIKDLGDVRIPVDNNAPKYFAGDYKALRKFRDDFIAYGNNTIKSSDLLDTIALIFVYDKIRQASSQVEYPKLDSYLSGVQTLDIKNLDSYLREIRLKLRIRSDTSGHNINALARLTALVSVVKNLDNVKLKGDESFKELEGYISKDGGKYLGQDFSLFEYVTHLLWSWDEVQKGSAYKSRMANSSSVNNSAISSDIHSKDYDSSAGGSSPSRYLSAEDISEGVQALVKQVSKKGSIDKATVDIINHSLQHLINYASLINKG